MLNFKKGLAMVLAAATALTFAPVANLGSVVDAQAADSKQGYNMSSTDFGYTLSGVTATNVTTTGTVNAITSDGTYFSDFDGLWMRGTVTLRSGRKYALSEISSKIDADQFYFYSDADQKLVPVKKLGTFYTGWNGTDSQVSASSLTVADGYRDKDVAYHFIYKLTSYIDSNNGAYITFMDQNAINNTYENIKYSITNKQNWTGASNDYKVVVLEKTSDTTHYSTGWKEASHENNGAIEDQYNLKLNNDSDRDYRIGVLANNATTWTGETATTVDVKASSTSGNIAWRTPDTDSAGITSTLETAENAYTAGGRVYKAGTGTTDKNLFYTTAANSVNNTINITYTLYNADKSKKAKDTQVINYVVDRSDKSVDWIKVGINKITDFSTDATGKWTAGTVGQTDTLTYKTITDMDPYINNSTTIIVKSESQDLQFISSDNTIVTAEKTEGKYYKAKVTAKGPGTATVSIYVNGTNNNKGKIYNIPVKVAVNAIDAFDKSDSESLLSKESKDTIYLDAADQTAANAVKSDKLTIASKGGLKITNVKSSDSSVVSIDPSTLTITSKANIADLATPKTATITWESVTDTSKHVSGNTGSIYVVVWSKPRADFDVDPVNLSLSTVAGRTKLLQTNPVKTNVVWTVEDPGSKDELGEDTDAVFTLTNGTSNGSTQTTATVVARAFGTGKVKALVTETATTRPTAKIATVTVGAESQNQITASQNSVLITEGDTATFNVSTSDAKKPVTSVTIDNADVATVASGAAVSGQVPVTVKGVKAGTANITIKASGAADKVIPVVVTAKSSVVDNTKTPAKVTGVKVTNKKGGYVTVTWNKQDQKNIKYYVKKTVGKKSSGKSVNGGKTTLTVKKGATVKVKVKAYVYDATGKKLVGTYSKTVTKKTDKK